jgi:hypothetical protein
LNAAAGFDILDLDTDINPLSASYAIIVTDNSVVVD